MQMQLVQNRELLGQLRNKGKNSGGANVASGIPSAKTPNVESIGYFAGQDNVITRSNQAKYVESCNFRWVWVYNYSNDS